MKIGFLVSGPKGFSLLKGVHRECDTQFVSSHAVKGLQHDFRADISAFCVDHGYRFLGREELSAETMGEPAHLFVAGWQYLIPLALDRLVVFHDSLLPALRGFAPTVTALISGTDRIGVTAFRPVEHPDAGPVYAQAAATVAYPIKIRDAYDRLAGCYAEAGRAVLSSIREGRLQTSARPQDEARATYSIWRGPDDYVVDWSWPAERIRRFADAVGWPYEGARTTYGRDAIILDEVDAGEDRRFEERHPGKIWRIDHGVPEVVCGSGMVRITSARYLTGDRVRFERLRERLGHRPDAFLR